MNKQEQRREIFEKAPIYKAVFVMAIPTVITQLINIVYNFADAWYVGRTQNPAMMATLSVCLPVYIIITALANLFGIGGSSAISRALGRGEMPRARKIFAFSLYGGFAAAILYGFVIFLFRSRFIMSIGGDTDSYKYIYSYMFWTMVVGAIPTLGNVLCGHLVRSIGASKEAGFGMSMGVVVNIRTSRRKCSQSGFRQPCRPRWQWYPISMPIHSSRSTEAPRWRAWASPRRSI